MQLQEITRVEIQLTAPMALWRQIVTIPESLLLQDLIKTDLNF